MLWIVLPLFPHWQETIDCLGATRIHEEQEEDSDEEEDKHDDDDDDVEDGEDMVEAVVHQRQ